MDLFIQAELMQHFFGMAQLGRFWLGRLSGGIVRWKRLNPRHFGWLGECDSFYRPIGSQTEANCRMRVIKLTAGAEGALETCWLLPEGISLDGARTIIGIGRLIGVIGTGPLSGAARKVGNAPGRSAALPRLWRNAA